MRNYVSLHQISVAYMNSEYLWLLAQDFTRSNRLQNTAWSKKWFLMLDVPTRVQEKMALDVCLRRNSHFVSGGGLFIGLLHVPHRINPTLM